MLILSARYKNLLRYLVLLAVLGLAACDKQPANDNPEILDLSNPDEPVLLSPSPEQVALQGHPGKRLHDAHCISCHDAGIYKRPERKMRDFLQLSLQVQRCNANLAKPLSSTELTQITEYLNQSYYTFKP